MVGSNTLLLARCLFFVPSISLLFNILLFIRHSSAAAVVSFSLTRPIVDRARLHLCRVFGHACYGGVRVTRGAPTNKKDFPSVVSLSRHERKKKIHHFSSSANLGVFLFFLFRARYPFFFFCLSIFSFRIYSRVPPPSPPRFMVVVMWTNTRREFPTTAAPRDQRGRPGRRPIDDPLPPQCRVGWVPFYYFIIITLKNQ